jgi:hypothetical protein
LVRGAFDSGGEPVGQVGKDEAACWVGPAQGDRGRGEDAGTVKLAAVQQHLVEAGQAVLETVAAGMTACRTARRLNTSCLARPPVPDARTGTCRGHSGAGRPR